MTKELLPGMINKKFGRIVNIASTAGKVGAAGYAGYCASKAGLIGLSKVTALEGAPYNISCISVSPTWVETPMMNNAAIRHSKKNDTTPDKAKEDLKKTNPQNRLVQPSEIAALIAFACGENCPALTNEDIQINAGAIW
jgi:NAD(P)-dependent dehydrogenase (short-subunit alcohol dehydrogenase family)